MNVLFRTAVKDGTSFNPERFLEDDGHEIKWLPFGIGPHACIGNKFAYAEMKILLIHLIKNFKLDVVPDLTIHRKYRITLRPIPDVEVFVSRR